MTTVTTHTYRADIGTSPIDSSSALNVQWLTDVALNADQTYVYSGGSATLTATATGLPWNSSLSIVDVGTGGTVKTCASTLTCSATVEKVGNTTHTYRATQLYGTPGSALHPYDSNARSVQWYFVG
jgi:hypothetical protein